MAVNDYAVVVGISRYPELGNLQGPENDARAVAAWLRRPEAEGGGGVPADDAHLALILSGNFPATNKVLEAQPAVYHIEMAFDRLVDAGLAAGGRLGRRLTIYLAGHGFGPDIEEVALLMANAGRRRMYHVPGRSYARWFRTAALFEEIVLWMDCCRDDYPRVPLHSPVWEDIRRPAAADVRTFFAFATKWSRKSREKPVSPNGPVQGVFTRVLLEALAQAAPNPAGEITGTAVEEYIINRLPHLLTPEEYQEPRFEFDRRHDLVLATPPPPPDDLTLTMTEISALPETTPGHTPVRITVAPALVGRPVELRGPDLTLLQRRVAGAEAWRLLLPTGLYLVQAPESGERQLFEALGQEAIDVHLA